MTPPRSGEGIDPACAACRDQRRHRAVDWLNHPWRGHGFLKGVGWSDPALAPPPPGSGDGSSRVDRG